MSETQEAKKCVLFQKDVLCLGKQVRMSRIRQYSASFDKVKNWPTCSKDVERFMGLANYHCSHMKDFAKWGVIRCMRCPRKALRLPGRRNMTLLFLLAFPKINEGPFILDIEGSGQGLRI